MALPSLREVEAALSTSVRQAREAQRVAWRRSGQHGNEVLADTINRGADTFGQTRLVFAGRGGTTVIELAEVRRQAQQVAAGFHELGLRAGDVLAIQLPNRSEAAVAYAAASLLGLVVVPIVHIYGPAEVEYIVRDSGAKAFVVPTAWGDMDIESLVGAAGHSGSLEQVVAVGDGNLPSATIAWNQLLRSEQLELPSASQASDDVCLLVYTSGTTADPKGVLHTNASLLAELYETPTPPCGQLGTPTLQPFPAGHTAGVVSLLSPWVHGGTTIMMDAWDPATAAALIADNGVRSMAGTPYYISTLLDVAAQEPQTCSTLQEVMTGGAGVPPIIVERGDEQGWRVVRCYGSTEQPSTTACQAADPIDRRMASDGRALERNEVKVLDEDGRTAPPGTEGEVVSIGPEQFIGYLDPDQTQEAFTPDGWFRTGDIGVLDDRGYLVITDRKKDVVIRGGENISSKQVEDILISHGSVAEVAVTAMPDSRYGERVCAFVILRPGASLSLEEVRRHFVVAGVARQKTPEALRIVASLPRTAAGKVKKHVLRAQFRQ